MQQSPGQRRLSRGAFLPITSLTSCKLMCPRIRTQMSLVCPYSFANYLMHASLTYINKKKTYTSLLPLAFPPLYPSISFIKIFAYDLSLSLSLSLSLFICISPSSLSFLHLIFSPLFFFLILGYFFIPQMILSPSSLPTRSTLSLNFPAILFILNLFLLQHDGTPYCEKPCYVVSGLL